MHEPGMSSLAVVQANTIMEMLQPWNWAFGTYACVSVSLCLCVCVFAYEPVCKRRNASFQWISMSEHKKIKFNRFEWTNKCSQGETGRQTK